MNRAVSFLIICLFLAGCARKQNAEAETGIVRTVQDGAVVLTCRMSETNFLAGGTAVLELTLEAPETLDVDFKKPSFDAFLVFAEEHPAYLPSDDAMLLYRHIYHLQARRPGQIEIPEIKVRVRDILNGGEPLVLELPALPVTVRGMDVNVEGGLHWSDPVEVPL